jgi:hypothetical protein
MFPRTNPNLQKPEDGAPWLSWRLICRVETQDTYCADDFLMVPRYEPHLQKTEAGHPRLFKPGEMKDFALTSSGASELGFLVFHWGIIRRD